MNELFGTKPWVQPVAVAASDVVELEESSNCQTAKGGMNKGI